MLGIIVFGVLAIFIGAFMFTHCARSLSDILVACVILLMGAALFFILVIPIRAENYQDVVKKYNETLFKINWMSDRPDMVTMEDGLDLYQSIRDVNKSIRIGKDRCQNVWNGALIDDKYLELEEISMPEWLSPYPNESP